MYLVLLFLPYLDPKREQYADFALVYHYFKDLIITFLFVLFLMIGVNGLGYPVNIGFFAPLLVGLLFVAIGAMLEKVKMNWFMGIRTPWTMSSETVWEKTHKMSGRVLMFAGIVMALVAFVPATFKIILFIFVIALITLGLPVYSYFLYAKEKKGKNISGQGKG
jgi:uncharacterized membrane protein